MGLAERNACGFRDNVLGKDRWRVGGQRRQLLRDLDLAGLCPSNQAGETL
jgi:hypothetical protein